MSFRQLLDQVNSQPPSAAQMQYIRGLMEEKDIHVYDLIDDGFPPLENLTRSIATELIEYLMKSKTHDPYQHRDSDGGFISDFLPTIDINDMDN